MTALLRSTRHLRRGLFVVLVLLTALAALSYRPTPSFAAETSDPDTCTVAGDSDAVCTDDGGGGQSGGGQSGGGDSGSQSDGADQADGAGQSSSNEGDQDSTDQDSTDQGDSNQDDSNQDDSNQTPPVDEPPSPPVDEPPSPPEVPPIVDPPSAPPTAPSEYDQCIQQSADWETACMSRGNTVCSMAGAGFGIGTGTRAGGVAGGGLYGYCDSVYNNVCRQGYADDVAECNGQRACRAAGGGSSCFDRGARFWRSYSPFDPWP